MDVARKLSAVPGTLGKVANLQGLGREDTVARMRLGMNPSVLLNVRWKRLVLGTSQRAAGTSPLTHRTDEGHVAGEKTSNAMNFAQQLNVERRWAVTGSKLRLSRPR